MLNAKLFRPAWWMQRVRKQKESPYQIGFGCTKHRSLASTVRMPAEKDAAGGTFSHGGDGVAQACAITLGVARKGRSSPALLAERQVKA